MTNKGEKMSELSKDVKKRIVEEKIQQLLAQSYDQEINKLIAEHVGNEEGIKNAQEIIDNVAGIVKKLEADLD